MVKEFKKVLVANRGEIAIRVFRACSELGIRTVGIYTDEDKYGLHRTKADESYLIGKGKGPIEAYLDMDEIIHLAKKKGVDAIHPGYGFLSENPEFVRKCEKNGITFIGPSAKTMESMGDKISSKKMAAQVDVPTIPGIDHQIASAQEAKEIAKQIGYPVILKASNGGGGRGMRIIEKEEDIALGFEGAVSESQKAFGSSAVFIEKYLKNPKHIEVQILGDKYGNVVHLYERDCSVQRRHQKIVEYAPAFSLDDDLRQRICADAVKLAKHVDYSNAGTLEFLVDESGSHYFIEMNPRIQVEHTVTEMITGIDLVQSQILVAQGHELAGPEIDIKSQDEIKVRGYSIQSRITTEDPKNNFMPDTGRIDVYRTGSGFGIRLDGGNGFSGSEITPFYDSLLVKTISWDRTFEGAARKAIRSLKELRVRGVKTNVGFLVNVLSNEKFLAGKCDTKFVDDTRELFEIEEGKDRATRILNFIGNVMINERKEEKKDFENVLAPDVSMMEAKKGSKDMFDEMGAQKYAQWVKDQKKLLITDTTMRDAHQSLVATRFRTNDFLKVSEATNKCMSDLFSLEMWGGATFDVAYRFLKESPWRRLEQLRKNVPNVMLQMLLRASNAVGYRNYPDNVIKKFIEESASAGIDVFRIFDSLNWVENMKLPIQEALKTGSMVEGSICYTGNVLDESKTKYNLEYYVDMAKQLESLGVHMIAIKDMAGLLKPYAAHKLISALKSETSLPVHLHTHDTSGNGIATLMMAANAGVDVVDCALESMSGLTSQPSMNSLVEALKGSERDTCLDIENISKIDEYYKQLRGVYSGFESDLKTSSAEIYKYEIPGGQYSNLKPQVESLGLGERFKEVKEKYKMANDLLGDIIKVTPSSKVVGDLAIFMEKNEIDSENIYEEGKNLSFPDSVVDYFKGMIGQPVGGFPQELQKIVLKGEEPITVRPGELLEDEDFDKIKEYLGEKFGIKDVNMRNVISYCLYPKVYEDYLRHYMDEYTDISRLESHVFFHGLRKGEECEVEIEEGKTLSIRLIDIGDSKNSGMKTITFELNGTRREVEVEDMNAQSAEDHILKADMSDKLQVGASIPGKVIKLIAKEGEAVEENQPLIVIEAMKMETTIVAKCGGIVDKIYVSEGNMVSDKQLLISLREE